MSSRATNRNAMLRRLGDALRDDERLAGMVLVGSGAYGFRVDESDIDIVAPVLAEHDATAVFQEWKQRIRTVLPGVTGPKQPSQSSIACSSCFVPTSISIRSSDK